jgi:hypothetical protein
VIPEGVTIIRNRSFGQDITRINNNSKLAQVTLPSTLRIIEYSAFEYQRSLKSIVIPEGVTEIGYEAFSACSSLASVKLPQSLIRLGGGAFSYSGITSVTLPSKLTSIEEKTFAYCNKLTSVVIPEGVTRIAGNAARYGAFESCSALTSVTLPSTIKNINDKAFRSCAALTTVTIPDSVKWIEIEEDAFANCPKLTLATQARLKKLTQEAEAAKVAEREAAKAAEQAQYQAAVAEQERLQQEAVNNAKLEQGSREAEQAKRNQDQLIEYDEQVVGAAAIALNNYYNHSDKKSKEAIINHVKSTLTDYTERRKVCIDGNYDWGKLDAQRYVTRIRTPPAVKAPNKKTQLPTDSEVKAFFDEFGLEPIYTSETNPGVPVTYAESKKPDFSGATKAAADVATDAAKKAAGSAVKGLFGR